MAFEEIKGAIRKWDRAAQAAWDRLLDKAGLPYSPNEQHDKRAADRPESRADGATGKGREDKTQATTKGLLPPNINGMHPKDREEAARKVWGDDWRTPPKERMPRLKDTLDRMDRADPMVRSQDSPPREQPSKQHKEKEQDRGRGR